MVHFRVSCGPQRACQLPLVNPGLAPLTFCQSLQYTQVLLNLTFATSFACSHHHCKFNSATELYQVALLLRNSHIHTTTLPVITCVTKITPSQGCGSQSILYQVNLLYSCYSDSSTAFTYKKQNSLTFLSNSTNFGKYWLKSGLVTTLLLPVHHSHTISCHCIKLPA